MTLLPHRDVVGSKNTIQKKDTGCCSPGCNRGEITPELMCQVESLEPRIMLSGSDLWVSDVTAPANATLSSQITVSWTVENIGDQPTDSPWGWYDQVYLSEDDQLDPDHFGGDAMLGEYSYYGDDLQPGDSYTVTDFVLNLPGGYDGDVYLLFYADNWDYEIEGDESNNVRAVQINVTSPDVDLQITNATAPLTAGAGGVLDLSWTVSNTGTADATAGEWQDTIYLSTDTVYDEWDDTYIGESWIYGGVAAGSSYTENQIFSAPNVTPGDYYILIGTDNGFSNNQAETDEANNFYALPITITQPDIDLEISAVAPASAGQGEQVYFEWTVTNTGQDTAAGQWNDNVYVSSDAFFDSNEDTYVASAWIDGTSPLGAGESYTTGSWGFLPTDMSGDVYLIYVADTWDNQAESDNDNNYYAVPYYITPVSVDLEITDTVLQSSIYPGEYFNFVWEVTNTGTSDATSDWSDYVYLSTDDVVDYNDVQLNYFDMGYRTPLAGGDSYTNSTYFSMPSDTVPGDYYILVHTDGGGYSWQMESDEDNNVAAVPVQVGTADLTITSGSAPSVANPGSAFDVTWTTQNVGNVATTSSWYEYVYLSDDDVFDSNDTEIAYFYISEGLAAGESREQTQSVTISAGNDGNYLFVVTDRWWDINEADENNNTWSSAITLGSVDLVVSTASGPGQAVIGESIDVSYTVQNTGSAPTTEWFTDRFFLSSDTVLDAGDIDLGYNSPSDFLPVGAGSSYSTSVSLSINNGSAGSQYVLVLTDGYSRQGEADENNNIYAMPLTLTAADLTISGSGPASAGWGEQITLDWTVSNDGDGEAIRGWYDEIYLSSDAVWDPGVDQHLLSSWSSDVQPFAPGATYDRSVNVTVPSGRIGEQYILFVTNTTDTQPESDQSNNVSAVAINLDGADLEISGTDAAVSSANWGEMVGVWWTVTNVGNRPATEDWYDYIYLSDDMTYDESDTYVTRVNKGGDEPFGIGDAYTTNTSITIPAGRSGQQYLIVVANGSEYSYDSQAETDDSNNTQVVPLTLYAPNLTISDPSAPSELSWGHSATVEWTATNTGDGTALSNWYDRVYLSLDDQLDGADVLMGTYSASIESPLDAGSAYSVSKDFIVPGSFTGAGYLIIKLDATNVQPESDEGDNTVALPVTIKAPDLTISNPVAPNNGVWGETITVDWTVTNVGDGVTAVNWYDHIYFSADDQFSGDDIQATSKWVGNYLPLDSGESYSTSTELVVPTSFEGAGYILFVTDGFKYLAETDEGNNVAAASIMLAAPDLELVEATAPTEVIFGEEIEVDWRVVNSSVSNADQYWMDEIWLSDDAVFDLSDTLFAQTWVTEGLASGDEYAKTRRVTIRQGSIGQQYLLVFTNRSGTQGESDYSDNMVALPINLSAPDLEVSDPSAPSQTTWGQPFDVSWTVTNVGNVTAPAYWTDIVYLSTDATYDAGDQYLGSESTWNDDLLTPGASYTVTRSMTVSPWMGMTGELYVLINVDRSNSQAETDESNNIVAIPISVGSPDLTVTNVSTDSSATFGQSVDVTWTVENIGSHATFNGWVDRIYLSDDPVYGGDRMLAEFAASGSDLPVAVGGSYTRTESIELPLTQEFDAGTYYLIVATDNGYAVAELSEDNNMTPTGTIDVALPSLPDLVVSAISGPTAGHSGESVELNWTLMNNGTDAATGSWVDRVYISEDDDIGGDRLIASFGYTGTIGAGESLDRTQNVVLPTDLQGQAWFVVRTNETGSLFEHTATDNNTSIASSPIDVTLYAPNLQVTAVTPPQQANSGQQATVEWTVTNVGNAATSAPVWYDRVYLSLDDTYQGADTYLGTVNNISYLNPGDSYVGSATVMIPEGVEGQYYFIIVTDAYNYVAELEHEDDNAGAGTATQINLTPPPDLQVTSARSIGTAFSGQPLTVEWEVVNAGDSPTQVSSWWDRMYLSQDNQIDPSEDLLVSWNHHSGRLLAGESYSVSTTAALPVDASGEWHLLIQIDAYNYVFEHTFEVNNVHDLPVSVTLTPPPDLEVTDVIAPDEVVAGQTMDLSWTVANFGSTATNVSRWSDGIYLSADGVFDPAEDMRIADVLRYGALGTSESYTRNEKITAPHGLEGSYTIFVVADRADEVFELDNENNVMVAPVVTDVLLRPADLVVSQVIAPTTVLAGQGIYVDWTVLNQGLDSTTRDYWYDRLVLSSDDTLSGNNDHVLGTFRHDGNIAEDESYTRNDFVVIPTWWSGDGYIIAVTDYSNYVVETNAEDNNAISTAISVTQQAPDLVVASVNAPTAVSSGQNITVDFTVRNDGDGYTTDNWYDRVYLTPDGVINGPEDIMLGQIRHRGQLAPGAQYDVSADMKVGIDLSGSWTIVVATDVYQYVAEGAGEDNNATVAAEELNVSLTPVADLTVSDITTLPVLVSGQEFNLGYTVNNIGEGDVDGGRYDSYYLSRDLVFDSSTDTYIGYQWRNEVIAAGAGITASVDLKVPAGLSGPMYVFVVADKGNHIYERDGEDNNIGYSDSAVQVNVAPPADLVAGLITIPEGVVPGQNVSLTYTVSNDGQNTAVGSWYDALYLSADETWDIGDRLIGRQYHYGNVDPGSEYSETLVAPLPGVDPGEYHVILRSDIRNNIEESDEANNFSASLDKADIDAEALTLGVDTASTLKQGFSRYYKVDVPAGQTLLVSLDSQSADDANRLYMAYGRVPTASDFDLASTGAFVADVELVVPTTEAGTYYIMAQAELVIGNEQAFDIRAELIPYSVRDVEADVVGDTGPVTLKISGARLTVDTTFELIGPSGVVHVPTAMHVLDPALGYATFDLAGAELGAYDVRAIDAESGLSHTLVSGVSVVDGVGAKIDARFEGPSVVRAGASYQVGLYYGNLGDADGIAPLIWLANNSHTPLGVTPDGMVDSAGWLFVGASSEGPAGVLRPGELYTIPLYFNVSTDEIDYDAVSIYHADDVGAIDWDYFEPGVRRTDMSDEQWAVVWAQVQANVGDTMGDLVKVLAANATLMPSVLGSARHPGNLLQMEVERAAAQVTNSISGVLSRGDLDIDVAGRKIYATHIASGETFQSIVRNDGSFFIANLETGEYVLAIEGAVVDGETSTYTVAEGQQIDDFSLTLVTGATVGGIVRSVSDGQPIGGAVVVVTSGSGFALYALTDAAGRYVVEGLDVGSYTISVDVDDMAKTTQTFDITSLDDVQAVDVMLAEESSISGRVDFADNGPEIHLTATAISQSTNQVFTLTTDQDTFELSQLPAGTYDLVLSNSGYQSENIYNVIVGADSDVDLGLINMELAASLSGQVISHVTDITPGMVDLILYDGDAEVGYAVPASDGYFYFTDFGPGTYRIAVAEGLNYIESSITLSVTDGQSLDNLSLGIYSGAIVSGVVTDTNSAQPISGITVNMIDADGESHSAVTDAAGMYAFDRVEEGMVQVNLLNGSTAVKNINVTDTDQQNYTADFNYDYNSAAKVTGRLRDASGDPIAYARAALYQNGEFVVGAVADELGRYEFVVYQPGTYDLLAVSGDVTFNSVANLVITEGAQVTQDIYAGTGSMSVTISNFATDESATIFIYRNLAGHWGLVDHQLISEGATTASFAQLAAGRYRIQVVSSDDRGDMVDVDLSAGQSVSSTATLQDYASMSGVIRADGEPIAGAEVVLTLQDGSGMAMSTVTDANGSYELPQINPDIAHTITVAAGGFVTFVDNMDALGAGAAVRDFGISASTSALTGRAVDASGLALAGAMVVVSDSSGRIIGSAIADGNGDFMITSAVGANLTIEVTAAGYESQQQTSVAVTDGGTTNIGDVTLMLLGESRFTGDITLLEDEPLPAMPASDGWVYHSPGKPGWLDALLTNQSVLVSYTLAQIEALNPPAKCPQAHDAKKLLAEAWKIQDSSYQWVKENEDVLSALIKAEAGASIVNGLAFSGKIASIALNVQALRGAVAAVKVIPSATASKAFAQELAENHRAIYEAIESVFQAVTGSLSDFSSISSSPTPESAAGKMAAVMNVISDCMGMLTSAIGTLAIMMKDHAGAAIVGGAGALFGLVNDLIGIKDTFQYGYDALVEGYNGIMAIIDAKERLGDAKVLYQKNVAAYYETVKYWNATLAWCKKSDDPNPPKPPKPPKPPVPPPGHRHYQPGIQRSVDPNDILGPAGYGEENFVSPEAAFGYTIRFENDAIATAPARTVVITQQLDDDLDWRTFRVDDIGWGEFRLELDGNMPIVSQRIDMTESAGYFVDVTGFIDVISGVATWRIETIDPATGEPPLDPAVGFLPPDDGSGIGQGFVTYSISPKANAVTGTRIDAEATIVFDTEAPLATPPIFHTLDVDAPTSSVTALADITGEAHFNVSWSGDDGDGAGVKSYDIYVSTDDGEYQPWLMGVSITEAIYQGEIGHRYAFYSVARDGVDLTESAPAVFDTRTYATTGAMPPTADDDAVTVAEDSGATEIVVLGNDTSLPDVGQNLTITDVTQPEHGVVVITGGGAGLTYQPDGDYYGPDTFTYEITDDDGLTDTASVEVMVSNTGDDPVANDDAITVDEDDVATVVNVLGNDHTLPDPLQTMTITDVAQPANGVVVITGGGTGLTYQPHGDFFGADSFAYTITDADGLMSTATVDVTVNAKADVPTAGDDSLTVDEDSAATAVPVLDNDTLLPDMNDSFAITGVTQPAHGVVVITGGGSGLTYQPDGNYAGSDTFTYTVTDSDGLTDTATVNVTVNNVVPSITTLTGDATVDQDQPASFNVAAVDVAGDGELLTYTWDFGDGSDDVTGVDLTNVNHIYAQAGDYTVRVTVTDANGDDATDSLSIHVNEVIPPVVSSVTIDDGMSQMSMVRSVTVSFDQPVTLDVDAIVVADVHGQSQAIAVDNPSGDEMTFVVTFTEPGLTNGSLDDGVYIFKVVAAKVHSQSGVALEADHETEFARLAGDVTGDGKVGLLDLDVLGRYFRQSVDHVNEGDMNGDGQVSLLDLDILGRNFNVSISDLDSGGASGMSLMDIDSPVMMVSPTTGSVLADLLDDDEENEGIRLF